MCFLQSGPSQQSAHGSCRGIISGGLPAWVELSRERSCAYVAECVAPAHGTWAAAKNFPGRMLQAVLLRPLLVRHWMLKPSFGLSCLQVRMVSLPRLMLLRRAQPHTPAPAPSLHLWTHSWKIASYNVLTLAVPARGSQGPVRAKGLAYQVARPSLLAKCLDEAGVDIAAIQEPFRHRTCWVLLQGCSGAEAGHLGTELWFRTGRVILCAADQPRNLIVHHASPRRLLVSLTQGASKLYILALHAPHRGSEPHAICQWWSETSAICNEHVGSHECIIAGDCNAAVGSVCSEFVFDHGAEIEDQAGALFHSYRSAVRGCLLPIRVHIVANAGLSNKSATANRSGPITLPFLIQLVERLHPFGR